MKSSKQRKKNHFKNLPGILLPLLLGAACGVLMGMFLESGEEQSLMEIVFSLLGLFIGMYAAIAVQLIIHEAGHLVFGLMSGYTFSSFRIFSLMFMRKDGRIIRKKLSIAGTGGQCLMAPPDLQDGKMPVALFNLGGSFMNLIASAIFFMLALALKNAAFLSSLFNIFALVGVTLALINGIPMRMGTVDNDGYNAFSLCKKPAATRAFWVQLKVSDEQTKGIRLKDMPGEWFSLPTDEDMKNSIIAVMGVFYENRLMDEGRFEEAASIISRLLSIDSGIAGLHKSLLLCDQAYIALIQSNGEEAYEKLHAPAQKKLMKAMKDFPSVLRTEYAFSLLYEKSAEKAQKIRRRFEKIAETYPYASDIESEMELIEKADKCA